MHQFNLSRWTLILIFLFLLIGGLYYAKAFLIPFAFAVLLSMLLLPLTRWFERKKISRGLSSLFSLLSFLAVIAAIIWLVSWQVSSLTEDLTNIEQRVTSLINKAKDYVSNNLGISKEKQNDMIKQQQTSGGGSGKSMVSTVLSATMGFVVDFILVIVYTFVLLYFRSHLKKFVMMQLRTDEKPEAKKMMEDGSKIAQQYLTGLGMMIVCLWIMYGIGFSIAGVKHAIFFAILCGLLEIIPFVGNITGTSLTVLMAVSQGGGNAMVMGVIITYMVVQFIQTYILEPLVVGREVNINPLFTILVLVIGEMIWGIPGLVLAIPLLGIVKIICEHVDPLHPYAFLIGGEKKPSKGKFADKLKGRFGKKVRA
jgi:predicted PurR-regulated permease PerM